MSDVSSGGTMPLAQLLRGAASELRHLQPPEALRERVLATQRRLAPVSAMRPPPRRWWRPSLLWSGAAVCALALLVSVLLLIGGRAEPGPVMRLSSGFVPVVGPERWQQLLRDSATPAWLVATEVPRETLALLGLPFDPARAAEPLRAEVLMHASGDVLALRLLGDADDDGSTR